MGPDGVRRTDWHDYEAMKRDAARSGRPEVFCCARSMLAPPPPPPPTTTHTNLSSSPFIKKKKPKTINSFSGFVSLKSSVNQSCEYSADLELNAVNLRQ